MAAAQPPSNGLESQFYPPNVQANASSLYYVKSTCASLSGSLAGLLGFTGALGFAFYLVTTLLVGAAFSLTKAHARPGEYFDKGAWESVLGGEALLGNAAPFVLFWTLFYALVHIYD